MSKSFDYNKFVSNKTLLKEAGTKQFAGVLGTPSDPEQSQHMYQMDQVAEEEMEEAGKKFPTQQEKVKSFAEQVLNMAVEEMGTIEPGEDASEIYDQFIDEIPYPLPSSPNKVIEQMQKLIDNGNYSDEESEEMEEAEARRPYSQNSVNFMRKHEIEPYERALQVLKAGRKTARDKDGYVMDPEVFSDLVNYIQKRISSVEKRIARGPKNQGLPEVKEMEEQYTMDYNDYIDPRDPVDPHKEMPQANKDAMFRVNEKKKHDVKKLSVDEQTQLKEYINSMREIKKEIKGLMEKARVEERGGDMTGRTLSVESKKKLKSEGASEMKDTIKNKAIQWTIDQGNKVKYTDLINAIYAFSKGVEPGTVKAPRGWYSNNLQGAQGTSIEAGPTRAWYGAGYMAHSTPGSGRFFKNPDGTWSAEFHDDSDTSVTPFRNRMQAKEPWEMYPGIMGSEESAPR